MTAETWSERCKVLVLEDGTQGRQEPHRGCAQPLEATKGKQILLWSLQKETQLSLHLDSSPVKVMLKL